MNGKTSMSFKRKPIKQHSTLYDVEYNYNHRVVLCKKNRDRERQAKKEMKDWEHNENISD